MTVINPSSISGITSITLPSGDGNVLTIHTNDGTERFRIDSSGNVKIGTAATISPDGDLFVTGVTTTGGHYAGSGANLTNLPAGNLTGTIADARFPATLPAISGANLTGIAATDNVRTGILDVAGISTFRNTVNIGAAVTISESGIEASGIGITCANINGTQIGGRRNIIINGAMMVAQRATSATATSGYTTLDRFSQSASNLANNCDVAQEGLTSGNAYDNGFRKSYKVTNGDNNADTNDQSKINYIIESQDLANSGWSHKDPNSYVTLSFWVKSSVAQTFPIAIYAEDANMAYGFEYSATTSWTKITHSIPGHASLGINNDNGTGFNIQWYLYMGTDTTASGFTNANWHTYSGSSRSKDMTTTWQTTNDATFEITGVQLEVGSQATPFEHRSFNDELLLCKRYFNMIADGSHSSTGAFTDAFFWSANEIDFMYTFPVQMRTTPSIYQVTGGNYFKLQGGGLNPAIYVDGNWNQQYGSKTATSQYGTPDGSGTVGGSCHITINNSATRYGYSAEL